MTHRTYRESVSPGRAIRGVRAHPGIGRIPLKPTRKREAFGADEELAMALGCSLGIRHDGCDDGMGAICPNLAEARMRRALAERQLTEFSHRLVNVLQMIVALIRRQSRRMQDDAVAREQLESLASRVHAAAALHRYLLPPRTHGQVDLGALVENVAVAIEGVTGLVCVVDAEPVHVPGQAAMHCAAAVNELAWNAHKHAYRDEQGGVIRIVCRRDPDARLRLSVADRGCGLPADFDPQASEGFGLMIVCAIAREFGGEIRVESEQGTRFTLLLNLPLV